MATACDRVTAHNFRALRRLRDVPKRRDVRQCAPPCRRCERWLQRAESRRSDRSCGGDTCRIDRGGETSACGPRRLTRRPQVFALCSSDGRRQRICPRTARRHPRQPAAGADRLLSGRRLPCTRCSGERTFAVAELATFYGRDSSVGQVLRRMRCSGACGGRVGAAWISWVVASEHSDRPRDDWLRRMKIGPYRDDGTAQRSIFEVLRFLSQNSGVCHINE